MARLDITGSFLTSAAVAGPTDAAATPLPRGGHSDSTYRTVTCEKIAVSIHGGGSSTTTAPRSGGGGAVVVFSVSCPDGSVVHLSAPARDPMPPSEEGGGGNWRVPGGTLPATYVPKVRSARPVGPPTKSITMQHQTARSGGRLQTSCRGRETPPSRGRCVVWPEKRPLRKPHGSPLVGATPGGSGICSTNSKYSFGLI